MSKSRDADTVMIKQAIMQVAVETAKANFCNKWRKQEKMHEHWTH